MKKKVITILMVLGVTMWFAQLAHSAVVGTIPIGPGNTNKTASDAFDHIDDSTETGYVDGADFGDGCHHRALIACQKLEKWIQDEGHDECSVMTAFAFDSDGDTNSGPCVLTPPSGIGSWGWHQICVLRCENDEGQWEDWYLDPAFEDGPVSQQDWLGNFCEGTPDLTVRPGPRANPGDDDPAVTPQESNHAKAVINKRNP